MAHWPGRTPYGLQGMGNLVWTRGGRSPVWPPLGSVRAGNGLHPVTPADVSPLSGGWLACSGRMPYPVGQSYAPRVRMRPTAAPVYPRATAYQVMGRNPGMEAGAQA
jgi:hypothetical protein